MSTEIERKFMVDILPAADVIGRGTHLRQGYLAEEGHVEVRIRISATEAMLTVKAGHGMSRTEVEAAIPLTDAESLWQHTDGHRVAKTRYRVAVAGGVAEVDVYDGALAGVMSVEVEFASEDLASSFVPPPWFGREITGDRAWSNASMARHGRPLDL